MFPGLYLDRQCVLLLLCLSIFLVLKGCCWCFMQADTKEFFARRNRHASSHLQQLHGTIKALQFGHGASLAE